MHARTRTHTPRARRHAVERRARWSGSALAVKRRALPARHSRSIPPLGRKGEIGQVIGVGERCCGTCPPHAERVVAMMMWRQRVAATKIDSPLMAVSGRHLRLEHEGVRGGWVINIFCNFFGLAHTTGCGDDAHRWGEIDQRGIRYEICGAWHRSRASR